MMTSNRRMVRALAALAAVGVAACSGVNHVQPGSALAHPYRTTDGVKPLRPGFEIGVLDVDLDNTSSSKLVLGSVSIKGPGVGSSVRVVKVQIAPLRIGRRQYEVNATPGGLYPTDPPVFHGKTCLKQPLFPVSGFRMPPGTQARLRIVLRMGRPGKWVIPAPVVYYTFGGTRYRQAIPAQTHDITSAGAKYIPPYYAEAECVGPKTGATFLSGYHKGPVSH
jgi:hypothetical protein